MNAPLDILRARLEALLNDAHDAWEKALGRPEEAALAAMRDGLQKTLWAIRATGASAAPMKKVDALPLFSEE